MQTQATIRKAEAAARELTKEWMRKTLHAAFVEGLQQVWSVSDAEAEIVVSEDDWQKSVDFVNALSQRWAAKLRQQDHDDAAVWLDAVYEAGKASAWTSSAPVQHDARMMDTEVEAEEVALQQQNEINSQENSEEEPQDRSTPFQPGGDDIGGNRSTNHRNGNDDNNDEEDNDSPPAVHPLRLIKRLARQAEQDYLKVMKQPYNETDAERAERTQRIYDKLWSMIQSGQTYWPQKHGAALEEIMSNIAYRMDASHNVLSAKNDSGVEIVPKSVWEKQQQQRKASSGNDNQTNGTVETLLQHTERKLKANETFSKRRIQPEEQEPPRPPSDIGACQFSMQDIIAEQHSDLDAYFHHDDATSDARLPILFGPLHTVGHARFQEYVRHNIIVNAGSYMSRRLKLARIVRERMGSRMVNKDYKRTGRSKILRTLQRSLSVAQRKYTWDLDLSGGVVLMERVVGRRRRLCAFGILEIVLEDENEKEAETGEDTGDGVDVRAATTEPASEITIS